MSTTFTARFSTSPLTLEQLLARLDAALTIAKLRFAGSVMRLEAHRGWPTVTGFDFDRVGSLAEAATMAASWWGIGLECISDTLFEGLGRTDAVEVYFNIFRAPDNRWTVSYLESSRATDHRAASDAAMRNLMALQIAVCTAGRLELSMYDEENHQRSPTVTLREVEVTLERVAADPEAGDLLVVASSSCIDFDRARRLAGPRADRVEQSDTGYVLFPFLTPMRATI